MRYEKLGAIRGDGQMSGASSAGDSLIEHRNPALFRHAQTEDFPIDMPVRVDYIRMDPEMSKSQLV